MSIIDFFRPKYKNSDPTIRKQAIKETNDIDTLTDVISYDTENDVVKEAINKITNIKLLEELSSKPEISQATKLSLQKKIKELKVEELLKEDSPEKFKDKLNEITSDEDKYAILQKSKKEFQKEILAKEITCHEIQIKIAKSNNKHLADLVLHSITDSAVLKEISETAYYDKIRKKSLHKLEQYTKEVVEEEVIDYDKQTLEEAETYLQTYNWSKAHNFFEENLNSETLSKETKDKLSEIYEILKEREEAVKIEKENIKIKEDIILKLENLKETPSEIDENLPALMTEWENAPKIADEKEEIINKEFLKKVSELKKIVEKITREKENYESKLEEAKKTVENLEEKFTGADIINSSITKIQETWKKIETSIEIPAELKDKYNTLLSDYNTKKELLLSRAEENTNKIKEIINSEIEKIKKIQFGERKIKDISEEVKTIKSKLNEYKNSTSKEINNLLTKGIKELHHIETEIKDRITELDLDRHTNYVKKLDILNKAESLYEKTKTEANLLPHKIVKELKAIRGEWKNIGAVPMEKADEIWNNFNTKCDNIFQICSKKFEELDLKLEDNYKIKTEILNKVEQLKESKEWKKATQEIKELQLKWKEAGHIPQKYGNDLYEKFKIACDHFFTRKRENYEQQKDIFSANAEKKSKLINDSETLSTLDWKEGSAKAKLLREEWKNAGSAGKDESELWDKFNANINSFFEKFEKNSLEHLDEKISLLSKIKDLNNLTTEELLNSNKNIKEIVDSWNNLGPLPKDKENLNTEFFDNLKQLRTKTSKLENENLKKKIEILSELKELLDSEIDKGKKTSKIKEIQKDWNSIGKVPAKEYKNLNEEFRFLCNNYFDNLKSNYEHENKRREENYNKKLECCIQIEKIISELPEKELSNDENNTELDLAKELKMSFEANFDLDNQNPFEEVKKLQQKWKSIGPVPKEHFEELNKRYKNALDCFYGSNKK